MSSNDGMPENISSPADSSTATGFYTPTSEQLDSQSTLDVSPLAGNMTRLQVGSNILPDEDLTAIGQSASIEAERNDDDETDLAPQQQEIIYDAEGDITLIVGPNQTHKFQLSSKLLASISTVWKDLITSAEEASSRTVHLPDDDPVSVTLLLEIIHLRFSALPRSITFQELYSLACLSQKYQVPELFQPFVWKWSEPFIREELDPEQTEWILISYEFCIEYIFKRWMEHLPRSIKKDENGYIVYRNHKLAELLPDVRRDELTKLVEETRLSLLSILIEVCKRGFEQNCCIYKDESPYQEQCNILTAGYLLKGLKSFGGWPLDPLTIRTSAEEFKANLISIPFRRLPVRFPEDNSADMEDHFECGLRTLKHEIASLRLPLSQYESVTGFNHESLDAAASVSPVMCRLGFRRRDFEIIDSDSEADESYDDPTDSESGPDEEFEEDNVYEEDNFDEEANFVEEDNSEEDSDEDGEGNEDNEDNEDDEESIIDSALGG